VPEYLKLKVNKYLLTNAEAYNKIKHLIGPVNSALIYNKVNKSELALGVSKKDSNNKTNEEPSIFAIDHLPLKGVEHVLDVKKFNEFIRYLKI
jgi:hypothetical protein